MIISTLKKSRSDSCASIERMIRDHALVFCSHEASCPESGTEVGSADAGSWR
jgi:hypothetical protein